MATQFAKKYLTQGRVVFPVGLKYDEKKSRDRGYPCKALDPPPPQGWQQLTMASVGRSFRLNSLGLVLGPVSGVLAVDIDNMDLWKVLLETLGESEPLTCRSISQRGAVHLLFKVTPALEAVRRKGVFGLKTFGHDDFDILGQGDFLLVPPSSFETPAGRLEYRFVDGYSLIDNPDKLIDAPQWLINALTRGSDEYNRVRAAYFEHALADGARVKAVKAAKGPDTNKDIEEEYTPAEEALIALDTQDRLREVQKHVKKLSADRAIDRQSWIEVGMAIHHATDGQGIQLWDEFSRRAGPYDRAVLETQWDSFKNGSGITIGSLIHWAKEDSKAAREERKAAKTLEEKTKTNDDLRREAVKFGVDHTGGKGVFDSWDNPENLVAVIKNTMHHPGHRVKCVLGANAAFQQCLECGWRNPICGHLSVPQSEYPVLHQQFFNITINNTVNHYNGNTEVDISWNEFKEDNIRIMDDPETNDLLIGALSGTNQRVAELAYHLYGPQFAVVNGCWYNFNGVVWEQDKERYEIKLCLKSKPFCRMFVDAKAAYMKETFKIKKRKDKVQTIQSKAKLQSQPPTAGDTTKSKAVDVAQILGIGNVSESLKDYDEDEKVTLSITEGPRGHRVNYLTEVGLYRIILASRKPFAKQFKKWVCSVIKEIRLTGQYQLQRETEAKLLEFQQEKAAIEARAKEAEAKAMEAEAKAAELEDRMRSKKYEPVVKDEFVYAMKESAELHNNKHKIGKTINISNRKSNFQTSHASHVEIVHQIPTSNAHMVEQVVYTTGRSFSTANYSIRSTSSISQAQCTIL
ncbi:hypothetical protein HK102_007383 [Quaeritorhiza haematococci]|nr:hypothetical protein HK102_007383 [Quaeritorhiza haematococci]